MPFIRVEAESALAGADAVDRTRAAGGAIGPLGGVPLAHKDMFYRAGGLTTCGSRIRRDFRPDYTATVSGAAWRFRGRISRRPQHGGVRLRADWP